MEAYCCNIYEHSHHQFTLPLRLFWYLSNATIYDEHIWIDNLPLTWYALYFLYIVLCDANKNSFNIANLFYRVIYSDGCWGSMWVWLGYFGLTIFFKWKIEFLKLWFSIIRTLSRFLKISNHHKFLKFKFWRFFDFQVQRFLRFKI